MNARQLLTETIKTWWNEPLPRILPRDTDLTRYFDPKLKKIISVIGFRRVGKTFTLFDFVRRYGKDKCVYINFEDERLPSDVSVLTQLIDVIKELRGSEPLVLIMNSNFSKSRKLYSEI